MKSAYFLILFFISSLFNSALSFEYVLESSELSLEQIDKANVLFNRAELLLPNIVKNSLDSIDIEFKYMGDDTVQISCDGTEGTKYFGQASNFFGYTKITLNLAFLNSFELDSTETIQYSCKHKNIFKEALATLLHETVHVFENHLGPKKFSNKATFKAKTFFQKNHLTHRSPDPYEFTNEEESLAVNFEYFLLDPDFKCRKPGLYRFYAEQFNHKPFNSDCQSDTSFYMADTGTLVKVSPSKLYKVDYLMAGPGDPLMSRFGHSMLRLVICKPSRPLGEDCYKDLSHHLVLSFRANTGNSTNYMKGLTGMYASQLYVVSFSKVMNEYNRSEKRDLFSYPLNLTAKEKEDFLNQALEAHWSYKGDYYFVQNNCAVETAHLLRSILDEQSEINKKTRVIKTGPRNNVKRVTKTNKSSLSILTPTGLRDALEDAGKIDHQLMNSPRISRFFTFKTKYQNDLENAFLNISEMAVTLGYRTLDQYQENSTAGERARLISSSNKSQKLSLFLLEENISKSLDEILGKTVNELYEGDELSPSDRKVFDANLELQAELAPWSFVKAKSRYGVPLDGEVEVKKATNLSKKYYSSLDQLKYIVSKYRPSVIGEFNQTQENLDEAFKL